MKSGIIQICRGQPEMAIRITQPGCGSQLINYEDVRLVIRAPHCDRTLKSRQCFTGCWPGYETPWCDAPPPHEHNAVVYSGFSLNDDGDTVFRFDDLLWELPPGRYIGHLEFVNGVPIAELDLDLCTSPFLIDRITVSTPTCDIKGGC